MDSYEDDISRAIALSLQDSNQTRNDNLDTVDGDYEEQLRMAIEASKAEISRESTISTRSLSPPINTTPPTQPPQPIQTTVATSQFLSERAQLEKERLERQKRMRKAQGLPTSDDEKNKKDDEDEEEDEVKEPSAKRQRLSSSYSGTGHANGRGSYSSSAARPSKASSNRPGTTGANKTGEDELFWDGELRPTATAGVEPRKDVKPTFRLTQILGKQSDIAFAIISTFALDLSWIYNLFDPSIPVILIAQPDASGRASMKNVLPNWIKTTPYLRGGFGCMHMKFMLIFYKTGRLRVAVTTANLIAFDWRDIENAAWLQDLPPLRVPVPFDKKSTDIESFQYVMKRVLDSLNVKPALATMIKQDHPNLPITQTEEICTRWDWSKVKVALVPSVAGKHEGWPSVLSNGHTRLMKAIRNMGCRTGVTPSASSSKSVSKSAKGKGKVKVKSVSIECQGSSIGQYTTQWLNEFYYSARGESAEDWLNVSKKKREKMPFPTEEEMKIVFPSVERVRRSMYGERGGGTIFCKRSQWESANFPRQLFRDSMSRAGNSLMHTKMILGLLSDKPKPSATVVASSSRKSTSKSTGRGHSRNEPEVIDLVDSDTDNDTSADSEAGTVSDSDSDGLEVIDPPIGWVYVGSHNFTPSAWGTLSGSAFNPVMNLRNYELGIVFPLRSQAEVERVVLFERPPPKYKSGNTPWFQEESEYFKH